MYSLLLLSVSTLLLPQDNATWPKVIELEKAGLYAEAEKLLNELIKDKPKNVDFYSMRGQVNFKQGKVKEAVADFDQEIKLLPNRAGAHWRRGLALYYTGQFAEGAAQFVTSDKVEPEDVENAVWHQLCLAKVDGVEKARLKLLKVTSDGRIPMMKVHELFAGKCKPEDVFAEAEANKPTPNIKRKQLFYANLYVGLYYEMMGETKKSYEAIEKCVDEFPQNGNYMMDVAKMHLTKRK